jgi:hypothetical protein
MSNIPNYRSVSVIGWKSPRPVVERLVMAKYMAMVTLYCPVILVRSHLEFLKKLS